MPGFPKYGHILACRMECGAKFSIHTYTVAGLIHRFAVCYTLKSLLFSVLDGGMY